MKPEEPRSSTHATSAGIDWKALSERYSGDRVRMESVVATFVRTQSETSDKLRHAAGERDFEAIHILAHSMKSTAGFMQAHSLRNLALAAEDHAKTRAPEAIQASAELADALDLLLMELRTRAAPTA